MKMSRGISRLVSVVLIAIGTIAFAQSDTPVEIVCAGLPEF